MYKKKSIKQNDSPKKNILFKVNENTELLKFLILKLADKSRKSVKSLLPHKQISVNEKIITKHDYLLKNGDEVKINYNKNINNLKGLNILFEDKYIIVIDKIEGLLSVSANDKSILNAGKILNEYLKKEKSHIFPVHRLDQDTSGVMMFAKNRDIQNILRNNWDKIVLKRIYIGIVEGRIEKKIGKVVSWLKEDKNYKMISSMKQNDGKKSITHYKLIKQNDKYSMLEVELETGRKNQIRVHMEDLGHCVIGDKKYGAKLNPIRRLGLHAHILTFKHPVTDKEMNFTSPIPDCFYRLFKT